MPLIRTAAPSKRFSVLVRLISVGFGTVPVAFPFEVNFEGDPQRGMVTRSISQVVRVGTGKLKYAVRGRIRVSNADVTWSHTDRTSLSLPISGNLFSGVRTLSCLVLFPILFEIYEMQIRFHATGQPDKPLCYAGTFTKPQSCSSIAVR